MFGGRKVPLEVRRIFVAALVLVPVWPVAVLLGAVLFFEAPSLIDPGPFDWDLFWRPSLEYALGPPVVVIAFILVAWVLLLVVHEY